MLNESNARIMIIDFCRNIIAYLNDDTLFDNICDDDTDYIPAATRALNEFSNALCDIDNDNACAELIDALMNCDIDDHSNEITLLRHDLMTLDFDL